MSKWILFNIPNMWRFFYSHQFFWLYKKKIWAISWQESFCSARYFFSNLRLFFFFWEAIYVRIFTTCFPWMLGHFFLKLLTLMASFKSVYWNVPKVCGLPIFTLIRSNSFICSDLLSVVIIYWCAWINWRWVNNTQKLKNKN